MAGVTGVTITAQPGQIVAPPPDGASYLGFIFARASIACGCGSGAAQRASSAATSISAREYPAVAAPATL